MLGKLIKYDLKAGQRFFLPVYTMMMVLAVLIGLTSRWQGTNAVMSYVFNVAMIFYAFLVTAAVVLTIYLLVERFYHNLLGNEGYLMFALPVSTAMHILAKIITAVLWILLGVIVVGVSGMIVGCLAATTFDIQMFLSDVAKFFTEYHFDGSVFLNLLNIVIFSVLVLIEIVTELYASIAVGHLWSAHRILGSVLAFTAFIVLNVFVFDSFDRFLYNAAGSFPMYLLMIGLIALYGVLTWYILDCHLDLA